MLVRLQFGTCSSWQPSFCSLFAFEFGLERRVLAGGFLFNRFLPRLLTPRHTTGHEQSRPSQRATNSTPRRRPRSQAVAQVLNLRSVWPIDEGSWDVQQAIWWATATVVPRNLVDHSNLVGHSNEVVHRDLVDHSNLVSDQILHHLGQAADGLEAVLRPGGTSC